MKETLRYYLRIKFLVLTAKKYIIHWDLIELQYNHQKEKRKKKWVLFNRRIKK